VRLTAYGTLFEALSDAARRHAGNPAMTFLHSKREPKTYTFHELFLSAGVLASRIAAMALDRRAPIGILVESQECQVLHYVAILAAGHIPAILTPPSRKFDRTYYAQTMRAVLSRCGFAAVVSDLPEFDASVRVLRPFTLESSGPIAPAPLDDCSAAAFLQFSSGTTGMKRGIVIDHASALAQLEAYREAVGLEPADRVVSWLPLYHDFGFIATVNLPLLTGIPVVMLQPLDWVADPASYLHAVSRYRGTIGFQPNFAFAFMAERVTDAQLNGLDLTSMRALVNASETVTQSSQRRFLKRFAPHGLRADVFWGLYGMAEMTLALTTARSSDDGYLDYTGPVGASAGSIQRPVVSVGKPMRGVELRIVDDDGRVLDDREIGEVRARAPFAFSRYYNNPEDTAQAFDDGGWYRSGDLGYRIGEALFICGRRGDVLIVNGVNVYPQDLEEIVSGVPGVKGGRTVAFSVADAAAGSDRIVVLAEPSPGADVAECAIEARRRLCSALQVSGFEIEFVSAGWLLKSSAGKIARDLNRRKWLDAAVGRTALPA
jgi:fatty-acyl-CoA synthase